MNTQLNYALVVAMGLSSAAWLPGAETTAAKAPKAKAERPFTPGGKWRAGDRQRPLPPIITPPTVSTPDKAGQPPSDASILFDGTDFKNWMRSVPKNDPDKSDVPKWKIENGYMEIVAKTGSITTREKFGDCQLHIEWAAPTEVKGQDQGRGNSGVILSGHPEIQVLDSYDNVTYADGQAAALYSQYPPLVNASRKPGEWQSYDIVYIAPKLENGKVIKPALYTVFHNGVLVHHAVEVPGGTVECSLTLQDHNNPVRYRNIWVRKLKGYDEGGTPASAR